MPSPSLPLLLAVLVASAPALAQTTIRPPKPETPILRRPGERQISPTTLPPGQAATATAPSSGASAPPSSKTSGDRRGPSCDEVRRKARFGIYFDKVEIEKLVQTVSDATCKTFILPENVKGKISIIGPENGKVEVDAEQFYAAFLAALDSNGLTVYPLGRFLKIVEKKGSKGEPIPTFIHPDEPYPLNEAMITKLFKLKYTDVEPVRGIVSQLVSKDGEATPFPPDTLIVHDTGINMHRLEDIIHQLDTRSTSDEIRIIQLKHAASADVANTIQKLFESKNPRGNRPNASVPAGIGNPGMPPQGGGTEAGSGGPVTLTQVIPDERTNKLILVASPSAFERIEALVREVDVPISGEGRINVYYLANANAEELATTLQGLTQAGGGANRRNPNNPNVPNIPGGAAPTPARSPGNNTADLFSGDVKISPDKGTNSLVIVASQADYRNIARVIEKLDIPRRQVFVEAVIMEVNLDRQKQFGISVHQGVGLKTGAGTVPGILATKYSTSPGLPPSFSLANLASFGGFLAGLQGPAIPALNALGLNIPSFGIVLHALQQSSDVNVLSTPHLLTSDNEEAEIVVGQNVPFQAGFQPSALGASALGTTPGATTAGLASPLVGLGGLGSLFAPINRQNVELKLTLKPQINESDFIRMVITEQTEDIASTDPVLGPTTSKRSAKTTVVARDQETVVIGGILQERTIESVSKVPFLGDIPIIGQLFRDSTHHVIKTNLLLFLTPYIIRDQSDFRRIFERKMKERQEFVEEFYGQVAGYDVPVDFSRKAGPVAKLYRAALREEAKAENGGPGLPGEQIFKPGSQAVPPPPQPTPAVPLSHSTPPQSTDVPSFPPGSSTAPTEPGEVIPSAGGSTPTAPPADGTPPVVQPPAAGPPGDSNSQP